MSVSALFLTHAWLRDRIEKHFSRLVRETEGQLKWHLILDSGDARLRCETLVAQSPRSCPSYSI